MKAPEAVIQAISIATVIARQSAVGVLPYLKPIFRNHNHHFEFFIDRRKPIALNRRMILQKDGALRIVVPLLATVLGSIGGEFISRLFQKTD